MRFKFLELQNFLSFGPTLQRVDLDNRGLVAVFGRNLTSSNADSNGAGKSTILEAIIWVLYGETMRNYSGDQVVHNKTGKECLVRLAVEDDDGKQYVIERTRLAKAKRPNDLRLFVSGVDASQGVVNDTQQLVHTLIGMDFHTFTQSVMLYSGGRSFSSMTDREQKDVLDDILQIDVLAQAKEAAKQRVSDKTSVLAQTRSALLLLAQQVQQTEVRRNKLILSRDQHAEITEERRLELALKRTAVEIKLDEVCVSSGLKDLLQTEQTYRETLRKLELDITNAKCAEAGIARTYSEKAATFAHEEGRIFGRLAQISHDSGIINQLVGKVCPTCRQVLSPDAADSCLEVSEQEAAAHKAVLGVLKQKAAVSAQEEAKLLKENESKYRGIEDAKSELWVKYRQLSDEIYKRKAELGQVALLEQQVASLDDEIKSLAALGNPYVAMVSQAEQELADFANEIRFLRYKDTATSMEVAHLNFWVSAFGNQGLKSHLLDSVIPFLTERAQYYADILSGGDLNIQFATQSQTKGGAWRDQFNVRATNRFGANVYEGNSDGEKRRVDLAVGWALGDLAAMRAHKAIRFKGLDEPFVNLDATGEDAVVRLLHKVVDHYETVICITHSEYLQSHFRNCITVVKDHSGSVLQ